MGQPSPNKAMRQRIAGIECRSVGAPSGEWWIGGVAIDAQRFRSIRGAVGCRIGGPRPARLDRVSNFAQTTSIDWSKFMLMRLRPNECLRLQHREAEGSRHLKEGGVDTTTILIIIVIVLLIGGGGWYGRGRFF